MPASWLHGLSAPRCRLPKIGDDGAGQNRRYCNVVEKPGSSGSRCGCTGIELVEEVDDHRVGQSRRRCPSSGECWDEFCVVLTFME